MYGKDLSEGKNFSNKRNGKMLSIIPDSTFLRLHLDDITYSISCHAQRLGSDQVRNATNE